MKSEDIFDNQQSDKLFIIGNGFDISLGLKTKYSDFANSKYWPFTDDRSYFHAFLNKKKDTEKWFDLERVLGEYEKSMGKSRPVSYNGKSYFPSSEMDAIFFKQLSDALAEYLTNEQKQNLDNNSVAAKIFKAIKGNGFYKRIISFNYTDLFSLAKRIDPSFEYVDIDYVHGSLKNGIVLGVPELVSLSDKYDFLYKTSSVNYGSHPLPHYLNTASEIVFYGHSLSENDYFYFKNFFTKQSAEDLLLEDSKYITIFTYDEASRLMILRTLRSHLQDKFPLLYAMNNFDVIKTDGTDEAKIQSFIKRQEESSLVNSIEMK